VCNARGSDRIGDAALLALTGTPFDRARPTARHQHQSPVEIADAIMRSLNFLKERRVKYHLRACRHPLVGKVPLLQVQTA
jgi:hypothetical protein